MDYDFKKLFPKVKFNLDSKAQLYRVLDELVEAEAELNNDCLFLEEVIDVIHSSFNLLYTKNYTNIQIQAAITKCIDKNKLRGKYE